MLHRQDVILDILKKGLVRRCIDYQTHGIDPYLKEELEQECWLFLLTWDWEKLRDTYLNKHVNRLITVWINRNYRSRTSPFHNRYRKRQKDEADLSDASEITDDEEW